MRLETLLVNEIYGPVKQGEGRSAGSDVVFLRLSGCNLACVWCDTPYTWNWVGTKFIHPDKFDPKFEAHKRLYLDILTEIYKKSNGVRNLVVSGGEPLLQQDKLVPFFRKLQVATPWRVEVETNGTIVPTNEFINLVTQFNCSPKTENSGTDNPFRKRYKPEALMKIASCGERATFKFVIQSDTDLVDAQDIILKVGIKPSQVWLMPEGRTKEEQERRQEQTKRIAFANNYNFSPRLHILEFGNKRAV